MRCVKLVSKTSCSKLFNNRRWLQTTKLIYGLDYYTILGKFFFLNTLEKKLWCITQLIE